MMSIDQHPRLVAKCRELLSEKRVSLGMASAGDDTEAGAKLLAALIVATAESEGRAVVALDGGADLRLPRHIRRMKLHRLIGLSAPAN